MDTPKHDAPIPMLYQEIIPCVEIGKSQFGGPKVPVRVAIKDAESCRRLLGDILNPLPTVDFTKDQLFLVAAGEQTSNSFDVEITEIRNLSDRLGNRPNLTFVYFEEKTTGGQLDVITAPWHVVKTCHLDGDTEFLKLPDGTHGLSISQRLVALSRCPVPGNNDTQPSAGPGTPDPDCNNNYAHCVNVTVTISNTAQNIQVIPSASRDGVTWVSCPPVPNGAKYPFMDCARYAPFIRFMGVAPIQKTEEGGVLISWQAINWASYEQQAQLTVYYDLP